MGIREAELSIGKWHAQTYDGRRLVSVSREGIRQGRLNEHECVIARTLLADADTWIRDMRKEGAGYGRKEFGICHMYVLALFSLSMGELYLVGKGTHNVLKVHGVDEMKNAYTLLASIWHK